MIEFIYTLGYYGPLIMLLSTTSCLWARSEHLIIYLSFFALNMLINNIAKKYFRESRPNSRLYFNDSEKSHSKSTYGMPSGHAQSIAFSITFLYLATRSYPIQVGSALLALLTMYQRVKFNSHTVQQVAVGCILGSIIGMISFRMLKMLYIIKGPK